MGDHNTHTHLDFKARQQFIQHLLSDIRALEQLLDTNEIEHDVIRIGAEQEFCLVDGHWRPASNSTAVLKTIDDSHFTTELAKYNLEANLDPFELKTDAFSKLETQLYELLAMAKKAAAKHDNNIILSGILPTISTAEVNLDYMTEYKRYFALNTMLKKLRGSDFRMRLSGVDELSIMHDSIMYEACNTSFQMHLQIRPDDFISSYNWAQAISAPVLGISVNSPLLFGKELWQETRIALFQQSIDTRQMSDALKDNQARVAFGSLWEKGSIVDIYKNEISRHKIILSKDIEESSLEVLKKGAVPKLQALNLHNGTIYRWNRACYGVGGGKAHVRIENRYIPSGPTVIDQMASFAFWVGLMVGRPKQFDDMESQMDFKDVKSNFIKAARYGSETLVTWMGKNIPLKDLIKTELLPIAYKGLEKVNIDKDDISRLLGIIEKRLESHTPAQWMIKSYRNLNKKMKRDDALVALTKVICDNQNTNKPIHEWDVVSDVSSVQSNATKVGHIMSTQLFTTLVDDTAELTLQIMTWKNIHHVPVVDHNDALAGLLTWTHIQKFNQDNTKSNDSIRVLDIMVTDIISVEKSTSIKEAIAIMKSHEIGCLPVLQKQQLVGIITIKDVIAYDHE